MKVSEKFDRVLLTRKKEQRSYSDTGLTHPRNAQKPLSYNPSWVVSFCAQNSSLLFFLNHAYNRSIFKATILIAVFQDLPPRTTGVSAQQARQLATAAGFRALTANLRKGYIMADEVIITPEDTLIEEGQAEKEAQHPEPVKQEDEYVDTDYDNDPMIVAMKEAEKELAAAEGAQKPDQTQNPEQAQPAQEQGKPGETAQNPDPQADPNKDMPMIPKARLDEALSKQRTAEDQVAYLSKIVDAQSSVIKNMPGKQPGTGEPPKGEETQPPVTDFKTQVEELEAKKLEIAEKYDEGELSFKEAQAQSVEIDRTIRNLTDQHYTKVVSDSKAETQRTLNQQNTLQEAMREAARLQPEYPYVAEIDAMPKHEAEGYWHIIRTEAAAKLQEQGVQAFRNNVETPEFIKAICELSNVYGPKFTGKQLQTATTQQQAGQPKPTAQERAQKIELSNQQPPSMANAGHVEIQSGLTAQDLEKMTPEQVADALDKDPMAVYKAAGLKT